MKRLYISDDVHKLLVEESEREGRTIQWIVNKVLTNYLPFPEVSHGTPTEKQGTPKNTEAPVIPDGVFRDEIISEAAPRTLADVKADIAAWEREMADSIDPNIVQDAETLAKNKQLFFDTRDALWAEYHAIKATE